MKYLSKIVLITMVALGASTLSLSAQDVDANRLNRDLTIMENILDELFKIQVYSEHNRSERNMIRVWSHSNTRSGIRGTYLPSYGAIFIVSLRKAPFFIGTSDDQENPYSFNFVYGTEENKKVTEESITARISEFLREYGSTMGQLKSDERIMVVYDADNNRNLGNAIIFRSGDREKDRAERLPTISVVAKKKDLDAFRSGNIGTSEFNDRLSISKVSPEEKQETDIKVMANIFKTAFEDQDEESFKISGDVNYLRLDNFGALFSFDVRYSGRPLPPPPPMHPSQIRSVEVLKDKMGNARVEIQRKKEANEESDIEGKKKEQLERIVNAYNRFINQLKEYIVDYGRTLKSISPEQHILVTATIASRLENLPKRVDLQLQKKVLDNLDQGKISREEAIESVTLRTY